MSNSVPATSSPTVGAYVAPVIPTLREIRSYQHRHHAAIGTRDPEDGSITYWSGEQLNDGLHQLRMRLVEEGMKPGEVIACSLVNGLEFVLTFLGITGIRCVAAPLNPAYTESEVDYYLKDMSCKALVIERGSGAVAYKAARLLNIPVYEVTYQPFFHHDRRIRVQLDRAQEQGAKVSTLPVDNPANYCEVESAVLRSHQISFIPSPQPDDVALILHTSGTTSRPKAVPLTHRNLCRTLTNICNTYRLTPTDRCLVVMPLFHVHGLMACLLSTLVSGGCAVIPEKFSAQTFWSTFDRSECTWYSAVPTIHQILLSRESETSSLQYRGRLKFIRSCSSALAPAIWKGLEATFKVPVVEAYAMTEAAHQMTSNCLPPGVRKPGSVGVGQGVEVKVLNDSGDEVPRNKEGEICVRGENVTKGYLNNPEANAVSFHKGNFFRTGDQGTMDADGYVFITGRLKELINRGGEKISPLEIDAILLSHPAVGEAIAFGKEDTKYGQEVAAAIVPKPDVYAKIKANPAAEKELIQSIQQHVASKLSSFKVPKFIYFNDFLPKTATGKIQRRHIAEFFLKKEQTQIKAKL